MKKKQSGKRERASAPNTPTNSLRELMRQKPCYAPFDLQAIIELGAPRKPSTEPLPSLIARLGKDAQELRNRAFAGEPSATKEFCRFAHNLIRQLTSLSEKKQPEISRIASTYEVWPILYAPDTDSHAIYKKLGVGTDSFIQRYAGRKIKYDNLWTSCGLLVLELMRWCKERLPEIRSNQPCRKMSPCFVEVCRTKIRIYYYDTPNAIFEVPEWCELCPNLPDKLRRENVDQFWEPGRLAILTYWAADQLAGGSAYSEALKLASPGKHNLESEKRNNALDAVKRAMISLAGK